MKTEPNDPTIPCIRKIYDECEGGHVEIKYDGLTKREHMAIEFTKALIIAKPDQISNMVQGVQLSLQWVDELIKQLNQD